MIGGDIFDYHFPNDPAKAKELRTLWSRIERQDGLGTGTQGKFRVRSWTKEEKEEWERLTNELLKEHPEYFGRGARTAFDAEMKRRAADSEKEKRENAGDADLLIEKATSKGKEDDDQPVGKGIYTIRCRIGIEPFFSLGIALNKYINCYEAGVSTPVSDGRYVWVADAYNLVACHDLKDGSIRWRKWTGQLRSMEAKAMISYFYDEYWPSPWLFVGKLFVFNNWYLHAFDPDSGKLFYSVDIGPSARNVANGVSWPGETNKYDNIVYGWGHDHAVNCAFLTVGDTPVVVIPCGWAVRASDGKVLSRDIGTAMMASGAAAFPWDDEQNLIFSKHHCGAGASGEPGRPIGFKILRLSIADDGALVSTEHFFEPGNGWSIGRWSTGPVQIGDIMHFGGNNMFDIAKRCWVPAITTRTWGGGGYQSLVAPGKMVWRFGEYLNDKTLAYYPGGGAELFADGQTKRIFLIPPLAEPVEPLQPQDGNCVPFSPLSLVMTEPADAPVRKWAEQAVKEGVISWLNPPPVDPCWLNVSYGAPPFFQGDRFYHRSRAYLYCVGPATKGAPGDDPATVAAIRAATDVAALAQHLDSPSAQYRYEALRKISDFRSEISESVVSRLKTLADADSYEENRAFAIRLLNGTGGTAGFDAIRPRVARHGNWWANWPTLRARRTVNERYWVARTFKALGDAGDDWLTAVIGNPAEPAEVRIGALTAVEEAERRADKLKFVCMDLLTNNLQMAKVPNDKSGWFRETAVRTLGTVWCDDPAAVDFIVANLLGKQDAVVFEAMADRIRPPLAGKFWRVAPMRCEERGMVGQYIGRAVQFADDPAAVVAELKAKALAGDGLRCEVANHIAEPDRTAFVREVLQKAPPSSKGQMLATVSYWVSYSGYDGKVLEAELKALTKDKNSDIAKASTELVKSFDPNWGAARDELDTPAKGPAKEAPPEL